MIIVYKVTNQGDPRLLFYGIKYIISGSESFGRGNFGREVCLNL